MSRPLQMGSVRRRPMPGMASADDATRTPAVAGDEKDLNIEGLGTSSQSIQTGESEQSEVRSESGQEGGAQTLSQRGPQVPVPVFGATHLTNFRLPIELHDRFRELVREAERVQPRLRRPSLTELVIGLLEEGPQTATQVAEVIARKRARERSTEAWSSIGDR